MEDTINKLDLNSIHVAFNGGLIYEVNNGKKNILYKKYLQFSVARELALVLREQFPKLSISVYDEENWNTDIIDDGILYKQNITKKDFNIVNFKEYFNNYHEVFKLMLITFDDNEMEKINNFLAKYSDKNISVLRSGKNHLEITHSLAMKSTGIKFIQYLKNITKKDCVAFGDGHNDIPMFECTEYRVVMDNALADIKKYANFVTKSNDKDGVVYAIKKYVKYL
nr:HAD-IIB family hydrolase [Gemella sp. ND 6198]